MRGDKPNFAGMTTSKRLFAAHLLSQFNDALRQGEVAKMIEFLTAVDLGADAAAIAKTLVTFRSDPIRPPKFKTETLPRPATARSAATATLAPCAKPPAFPLST